jgi:hypothetical protein
LSAAKIFPANYSHKFPEDGEGEMELKDAGFVLQTDAAGCLPKQMLSILVAMRSSLLLEHWKYKVNSSSSSFSALQSLGGFGFLHN